MNAITRALNSVISQLVDAGDLVLVEGATTEHVTAELVAGMRKVGGFTNTSTYIVRTLVASPHVDELYASDQDIIQALRFVDG